MARRKRTTRGKTSSSPPAAEEEKEWLVWFEQVEAKKKALHETRMQPFVVCESEKDGNVFRIARQKSRPLHIAAVLKIEKRKNGGKDGSDMPEIQALWSRIVDPGIACESSVYSFRKGILTISIFNSSLHQEIRQFHHGVILENMRNSWAFHTPLLKIQYRLDNR